MAAGDSPTDDDGFVGYAPSTVDPGNALLIAIIVFTVLSNAFLPCLVSLGRRYERKRIEARSEEDVVSEQPTPNDAEEAKPEGAAAAAVPQEGEANYIPDSYVRDQKNGKTWKSLLDQVRKNEWLLCVEFM